MYAHHAFTYTINVKQKYGKCLYCFLWIVKDGKLWAS